MAALSDIPAGNNGNLIQRIALKIWDSLIAVGEASARTKEIEYYASLSDEQLAARGIKREQIVLHVYRDRMAY